MGVLTTQPTAESARLYALRGGLRYGTFQGRTYEWFQYKITDGARIWYFVEPAGKDGKNAGRVLLERCMPGHPKETE
ncbi:hypothetical protein [Nocardia donostiensis]|uniref:hypothetical protein n=1 Tax=Nocardia donostiensis TaxID=1538463 RepID=UPI001C37A580|nr:hypothetical protein [Nocardia donostiensis]